MLVGRARCAGSSSTSPRSASARRRCPERTTSCYIGGGQDREQALIAPDIAAKGPALAEAVAGGAAVLAVCGGYQLLGRFYRDRYGIGASRRRRCCRSTRSPASGA